MWQTKHTFVTRGFYRVRRCWVRFKTAPPILPGWQTRIFKQQSQKGANSYQAQEAAKHANMLRLRAERLAREATNPPEKVEKVKTKARNKVIRE